MNLETATAQNASPMAKPSDLGSALLRAFGVATVVVLAIAGVTAVVLFLGLEALPTTALPYYGGGVGAALFAGMVALFLHGRFLDPKASAPFANDGRLMAQRLQSLLAAAFGAKLAVVLVGVFALRTLGVKFADFATFGVTFAGAALLCQLATALSLARTLQHRGASRSVAPGPAPEGNTP